MNVISFLLQKTEWLTERQKGIIAAQFASNPTVLALPQEKQAKLCAVLCAISYCEVKFETHRNPMVRLIMKIFNWGPFKYYLGTTLGPWNLGVFHASKFNLPQHRFRKILTDDAQALPYIILFIINHIGLDKSLEHIFADYNLQERATRTAALQRALNLLLLRDGRELIAEDGIIGGESKRALELYCIPLDMDEEKILLKLEEINRSLGSDIRPFVPQPGYKINLEYALEIFKRALHDPKEIFKLKKFFRNHCNVPLYTQYGLEACVKIGYQINL